MKRRHPANRANMDGYANNLTCLSCGDFRVKRRHPANRANMDGYANAFLQPKHEYFHTSVLHIIECFRKICFYIMAEIANNFFYIIPNVVYKVKLE